MKTSKIRLGTKEKIGIISNMSTMLAAGIPILETIESLLEDAKGNQLKILSTTLEMLKQGKQLNEAFAQFPNTFNPVTTNLVKASEESGNLDTTLKDLAENIRKEAEFADKIKSALTYPAFIMVVFFGILILMLTFVIPRIASVFSRLKVQMPLPTQIMIFSSNLLMTQTIPIVAGLLVIVAIFILIYKTKRDALMNILFMLPVISTLIREIDVAQFTRSLYLLLSSGVPITPALELCQDVVSRKDVKKAIVFTKNHVSSGNKMSEAFKKYKNIFPPIIIKITEAGEKTGSLDTSMKDASAYMDYEVDIALKKVTTLMEPLMLVLVGTLIGGMMMAIIAPMYGIISQIGNNH